VYFVCTQLPYREDLLLARAVSIFRRHDGKWCAVVPLPGGRRKSLYGPSREAVEKRVGDWRMSGGEAGDALRHSPAHPREPRQPSPSSASDWLTAWAAEKHSEWGPRRQRDAKGLIRLYVTPHWQDLPMTAVTQDDAAALLSRLDHIPVTQDNLRRLLRVAFKAVGNSNAIPSTSKREQRLLTEVVQRQMTILEAADWPRLIAATLASNRSISRVIGFLLETGMRSEEVRALHWGDWDRRHHHIRVNRAVVSTDSTERGKRLQISELTKSSKSRRRIPLTDSAETLLQQELSAWYQRPDIAKHYGAVKGGDLDLADLAPPATALIWPTRDGTLLDPSRLSKELNRLLAEIGIQHLRVHDLRHTHASHLVAREVDPVTIRDRMGWTSIKMLDPYAEKVAEGDRRAVEALNLIAGPAVLTRQAENQRAAAQEAERLAQEAANPDEIPF
jgi:integrase